MQRNKGLISLVLLFTILLSTTTYADVLEESVLIEEIEELPQILEINSEIKYGPFSTDYIEPRLFYDNISIDSIESIDIAHSYEELKETIYKHMKNYEYSFSINYKGDTSDLKNDISRIWEEIFESDHYLYGTVSTYGEYKSIGYENDVTIDFTSFTYHTNKVQEKFVDSKVADVVNQIIEPNMNEFQKVKAINDWVVNNTRYNEDTTTSPHAAYTLFNEGEGVCQAYALATLRLLEEEGFEVKYVTGKVGEIPHGWNLVKVDGKWYHLDTTWNDPVSVAGDILSYKYFLISDKSIETDHERDERSKAYPKATDTYYETMRYIKNPVELDNSLFYIKDLDTDDYKLYKLKLDTMTETQLTNHNVQFIAGYEDWIYYSNYSYGGYIFKIKIDGTDNIQLNNVNSKDLYIDFPYLHFYDYTNKKDDKLAIDEIIGVTGISLNRTEDITLILGGQPVRLEARVEPLDVTNKSIIWTSSNKAVATVEDGLITAKAKGETIITVTTADGKFSDSVNVEVKDGYKILDLNDKKIDTGYSWTIKLNKSVKEDTVDFNSVYVENEFGERLHLSDFDVKVLDEDPTLIAVINKNVYEKDKLYYIVIENTLVSTKENEVLKEAVKMPFIIK
ncbi:transglutaminase domain-containing protein [Tissierella pigra]|uniref:DUF5050 domain-containing protein n=1 Tax=Tissierella pigra TaxID=2607614 RepID=A0A6N7XF68_9FIRM|nr:transglutaminase domain-containing protein [Tissierella pigra]MSU00629.1 DUF5050 domain-containing protein [Tissierella pigra]